VLGDVQLVSASSKTNSRIKNKHADSGARRSSAKADLDVEDHRRGGHAVTITKPAT
jgi:hypothetical protein